MTTYGPWVQPEDTWALSDSWRESGLESEGDFVASTTDTAGFAASVTDVIAGTNVVFDITLSNNNIAFSPSSAVAHIDVAGGALAWGRLYVFSPRLDTLFFGPVIPPFIDWPTNALDYELEEPEGVPYPGTIKVYGYVMQWSNDASGVIALRGSSVRRLMPGDYTLDGLGRPNTTWVEALNPSGPTLATFAAPLIENTYQTDPFEITDLSPDTNDLIVFSVLSDPLHDSWVYGEGHATQILQTPLVNPPTTGALPIFGQFYTPPRYRWVYEQDAPLRQFPRSDNLVGTGGARQRGNRSRQSSIRQGWAGTHL